MKWKPYPKYKDSGVEWLGEVPEHWVIRKASQLFGTIGSGTTPPSDDPQWYQGDIPWVTTGELREGLISDTVKRVGRHTVSAYPTLRIYAPGTLLIAMYGATIGRLALLGVSATTNQACCALSEPRGCDSRFVFFLLQAFRDQIIRLASGGGQPNINQDTVRQLRIATPPPHEQQSVRNFLDRETGKIDALIAKEERLIELLQEKRHALISHAVTKGLNPDATMRQSGVEWLEDVPAHWDVTQVKRVASVRGRIGFRGYTTDDLVAEGEGAAALGATHMRGDGSLDLSSPVFISWNKYRESPEIIVDVGDLLVVQRGSTTGKASIVKDDIGPATINPSVVLLKQPKLNGVFFLFSLLGHFTQSTFQSWMSATAIPMLSQQQIGSVYTCAPPKSEQDEIVSHLNRELKDIDALVVRATSAIGLSREHRTALISSAVTGKIDVRITDHA